MQIRYTGPQIDQEGLLQYIVSFRNHNEFHEQCVERIFMDLWTHCKPIKLMVYARYTRRGGWTSTPCAPATRRHCRPMCARRGSQLPSGAHVKDLHRTR